MAEDGPTEQHPFADSRFGWQAVARLRTVFEQSRNPMLIADDQRRWVAGNAAACKLLGVAREDVFWHRMDDFTPASERLRLRDQWAAFLVDGPPAAEGWHQLYVSERGASPVEFSLTADVLPSRHLAVFIPPEESADAELASPLDPGAAWQSLPAVAGGQVELTEREHEIMTLVAAGLQSAEIAERLFLSSETVKSHVHHAMGKLGAHTRAGAVTIALVTGQISWELPPGDLPSSD
jgi:DNA-binding CsgD family transcriptional regulator